MLPSQKDPYPFPLLGEVLDKVVGHENNNNNKILKN
jgi:hypothetical protein